MPRRAIWTGAISFGLVNIPVRLYPATQEKDIRFHLLHDQDKSRLQRKLVSAATGREVHSEHIVKGFEFAKDHYVVMQKDDLEGCAPEKSKTIEITDFVDLSEIDPLHYEKPYYAAPQATSAKSYHLLVEAMRRAKKVAIAEFVMHEKEHLAALRPIDNVLCVEMMRMADEIVPVEEIGGIPENVKLGDRELKAAHQLIESLSSKFHPEKYHDDYRDCIMKIVERKAKGEEIVTRPAPDKKPHRVTDLMSALEASLAEAQSHSRARSHNGHNHNGRRRKSA